MGVKAYKTTLLIWATLIVGEIHTLWENSTKTANWIISENVPMTMQWNFKMACDELNGVLIALAFYCYERNRINLTSIKVFVLYYIADFLMYFYNYKQKPLYGWVYLMILISWILIYNNHGRGSRTKNRQGIIAST